MLPAGFTLRSLLVNLIHVRDFDANIISTFSVIAHILGNVIDAQLLVCPLFDFLNGLGTVESAIDFFEGGAPGLNEEEIDSDELDDQPAFEEEIELPAASGNAERDGVLRQEQADVCGEALHEQAIGADLEAENLEWVGNVEGDPKLHIFSSDRRQGKGGLLTTQNCRRSCGRKSWR